MQFQIGEFALDEARFELTRAGGAVHLLIRSSECARPSPPINPSGCGRSGAG
jgi:hypothetical protein